MDVEVGAVRCVACGGSSDRVLFEEAGYAAHGCACGGIYITPAPPGDAVDPTRDVHSAAFYALPARRKVRWIRERHPGARTLLEVGAGDGWFLEEARRQGFEVSAIEPEPERASRLRERMGIRVECGLIEDVEWDGAGFDVVFHCDLLSHFPDPVLALQRMAALLAPGGVLFFEVGLVGGIDPRWYDRMPSKGLPDHRWFFSEEALQRLLVRAGLRLERMQRFGLGPGLELHRLASALRPVMGRGRQVPSGVGATSPVGSRRERVQSALRYGVGGLFPGVGPGTALVVARPAT